MLGLPLALGLLALARPALPSEAEQQRTSTAPLGASAVGASGAIASQLGAPAAPLGLRVEHMPSPRGVGARPRLSWRFAHPQRAQVVGGYNISVEQRLGPQRTSEVWVHSQPVHRGSGLDPLGVVYAGAPLSPDSEYIWRVQVWDGEGRVSPWSNRSTFVTGLFSDSDWSGAAWIGMSGPLDDANQFRKVFSVPAKPPLWRCSMIISGLGYFVAHLGGERVSDHELGESTQFESQLPYSALDCTAAASRALGAAGDGSGANTTGLAVGVELGRGWYAEQLVGALGNQPSGERMLRMLVTLTYVDGQRVALVSDGSWRRAAGPIIDEQLHLGIVYDARRETPGWTKAIYDDSQWSAPDLGSMQRSPALRNAQLTAMIHPSIRKTRTVTPRSLTPTAENTWLLELPQNIAVRLDPDTQNPLACATLTLLA